MKKKLAFPLVLALVASLLFSSVGLAQSNSPQPARNSGRRSVGQVTAIDSDQFTATTRNGESYPVLVDEATRFRNSDGSEASFDDLQLRQWVIVIAAPQTNDPAGGQTQFVARLVVLLPDEIDLSQRFGVRARGVVTAVDPAAGTFSLRDLNGQFLTLAVDENTHFIGKIQGLSDLQPGMGVAAAAQETGQAYPLAVIVAARTPLAKHAGKIVSIDLQNGSFQLETVRNGTLTFHVNDQTHFQSPDQSVQGLEDLQPDMVATVTARQDGTELTAVIVAAANRSDLPSFEQRITGRVVAIGGDSFQIEKPFGEQVSFVISPDTRFRSAAGRVQSLDDLRVGMRVVVGADKAGDGYQAVVVIAGAR